MAAQPLIIGNNGPAGARIDLSAPEDVEILIEVLGLVEQYSNGTIQIADASAIGTAFVERLAAHARAPHVKLKEARKGLCELLTINHIDLKLAVLKELEGITTDITIENGRRHEWYPELLELERVLRDHINRDFELESENTPLFQLYLDCYANVIEQLLLISLFNGEASIERALGMSCWPDIQRNIHDWSRKIGTNREFYQKVITIQQMILSFERQLSPFQEEVLEAAKKMLHHPLVCASLGDFYSSICLYYRAIHNYEVGLKRMSAMNLTGVAKIALANLENGVIFNLGDAYYQVGNNEQASKFFARSLESSRKQGDKERVAKCLAVIANLERLEGRFKDAMRRIAEGTRLGKTLGDKKPLASIYSAVAKIMRDRGQTDKAVISFRACEELSKRCGDFQGQGQALNNLGTLYLDMGNFSAANSSFRMGIEIARKILDQQLEVECYVNLGNLCYQMTKFGQAIEFQQEALEYFELNGRAVDSLRQLGNLGNAYLALQRMPEARKAFQRMHNLSKTLGAQREYGIALLGLGRIEMRLGNIDEAERWLNRAKEQSVEAGDSKLLDTCMFNFGELFMKARKFDRALEIYASALKEAEKSGTPIDIAKAQSNLGGIYLIKGDPEKARDLVVSAVKNSEKALGNLSSSDEWKISFFEEASKAYEKLENILLMEGKNAEALAFSDSRRAKTLNQILKLKQDGTLEPSAIGGGASIREMMDFAQKHETSLIVYSLAPCNPEFREGVAWVIDPRGSIEKVDLSLSVFFIEGESDTRIFSEYPFNNVEVSSVKSRQMRDEETVDRGRKNVVARARAKAFKKRLQDWNDALIRPLIPFLPENQGANVTIIPDGFLSQIPFSILRDEEGQYLIEKFAVSVAPSVRTLMLLISKVSEPSGGSLVIGNPTSMHQVSDLPKSEEEAQKVATILETPESHLLTKKGAGVQEVLEKMKEVDTIHLACHGDPSIHDDPHSVFSGALILSGDRTHVDGILYAKEISRMSIKASTVFLSACHSGRGTVTREGVISNVHAFLAAGASSVVSTLWQLPDSDQTVEIVERFYNHQRDGLKKSEALRDALLPAIEANRENPQSWGALFVSGLI